MYEPIVDPDGGLFLFYESQKRPLHFRGAIYGDLALLLDGQHCIEAIYEILADRHPAQSIFLAVTQLLQHKIFAEERHPFPSAGAAYWEHIGANPDRVRQNISRVSIAIRVFGSFPGNPMILEELLHSQGFRVEAEGDVTLILSDNYLRPELERWNGEALVHDLPWLLIRPVGIETWLGPAFQPHSSACWECLAHRLRWHRRLERHLEQSSPCSTLIGSPRAHNEAVMHSCLAQAVEALTRWLGCAEQSILHNRVISRDSLTWESRVHQLQRRPQCPACGSASPSFKSEEAVPIHLQKRSLCHVVGGGLRTQEPEQVLRQLQPHLSPITGIISQVEQGPRTSRHTEDVAWPTPIFIADHNFSDMQEERFFLREGLRRRAGGKGTTETQAMVSALAESVERYCGVFDGTEPRVHASFRELADRALHPNGCMGFSDRQFGRRDELNQKQHKAYWVPPMLDDAQSIDWTPLWSLTQSRTVMLPTSLCYYGYRSAAPSYAYADSNGCASGSCMEEALLQGLLELIERDAVAIWWYNRLTRQGIDLASVSDPYVSLLVSHYQRINRDVWALDITSDIGIPVYAAISRRVDQPQEDIIYGFGCHPDGHVALIRALTELNQSLEAVPCAANPATEGRYLGTPEAVFWWSSITVTSESYLLPNPSLPGGTQACGANAGQVDLMEALQGCIDRLDAAGIEVLALNQTRPDIDFPVARVVAPGLRHFWPRFAPGRLYDVPVQQGWRRSPLREQDFNPYVVHF